MSGYYDYFPPKRMNVSVQHKTSPQGNQPAKKILVAQKDFAVGETIYKVILLDMPDSACRCSDYLRKPPSSSRLM